MEKSELTPTDFNPELKNASYASQLRNNGRLKFKQAWVNKDNINSLINDFSFPNGDFSHFQIVTKNWTTSI